VTANSAVSWVMPMLTQPALNPPESIRRTRLHAKLDSLYFCASPKLDFGQFSLLGNGALQVFLMPAGIFARSRARPGPTKNSVYPYILGHFAHPPLRKLAKVKLRRDGAASRR
jgi:hypothetical protein